MRLLIVDDERDVTLLFEQRFRRRIRRGEIELCFAYDGHEALERLRADPEIHVVLSDINMPGMDGLTLLGEVGRLDRVVEVIIVSAYGDMTNIRTAMNRGSYDFLTKPIDFTDLDRTLDKTLSHVEQRLAAVDASRRARELQVSNEFIRSTFGRYVSDDVVEHLLKDPDALELGGERRSMTILAADVRGFTSLAERLEPEEVIILLNRYFEAMFSVIHRHGGTVNAILGDGLFVFFGAPIVQEDSARRAVACALEMMHALLRLKSSGDPHTAGLEAGIGIHTGAAVVGNIGSADRAKYSAIGRDVNLAARIEACTVGGQILISEATAEAVRPDLVLSEPMEFAAKGIGRALVLFELQGLEGEGATSYRRERSPLHLLSPPLSVRLRSIDGGVVAPAAHPGALVRASLSEGELATEVEFAPLGDLVVRLFDRSGEVVEGELYAKVLGGAESGTRIGFTSMSPIVRAFLAGALPGDQ